MGQKVHPYGFRLGYTKPWKSRWFVERDYDKLLLEDYKLKTELKEKLKSAGVSSVEIERPGNKLRIIIKTARPGIIIGRKGAEIDKLKQDLQKKTTREVHVDIQEVHKPELDAQLVSESIALQLEKRVGFRRAMRKSVDSALRFGKAVVDIGPQRVQRQPPLQIPLRTRDFIAVQPPAHANFDPLATEAQRRIHRLAHRPPEAHPLFQLQRNRFRDQLCVQFRLMHFLNIDMHFAGCLLLQILFQLVDFRALAPDDDSRTRRLDNDPQLVARTLDLD